MTVPLPRLLPAAVSAPAAKGWPRQGVVRLPEDLGMVLLREGRVAPHLLVQALSLHARRQGALGDILLARGMLSEDLLYDVYARHFGARRLSPLTDPPDVRLIDRLGAAVCLRDGLLPWRKAGAATVIATAQPEHFQRHRVALERAFGPVVPALAPKRQIDASLLALRGRDLRLAAETRVAERESCRNWGRVGGRLWLLGCLLAFVVAALIWPAGLAAALTLWAAFTLVLTTGLKLAAALVMRRPAPPPHPPPIIARQPIVSVMVALYREGNIAARLIGRLGRLDYPHDLLDIVLVVEETDLLTRNALDQADLPGWMRVVVVPDGPLKTKPRALNFALDFCRGAIIGVYDAEDAPASDQIRRVVDHFHSRGPEVACLQGVLDFYNPRTNWLSRCFTMEYATWFRMILPGLARLGLVIPLGGTTLFFRRAALERLGGWDAHNVTEDADLGIRLARHGYRTEIIDTVTEEEANCRALPWVKQRSRWLKGYMMTYAVHMRDPRLLWRQLGPRKFAGFQVLFLGTLSQFLLAPVLWSFWLLALGLPHLLNGVLPDRLHLALLALFIATEAANIVIGVLALRKTRHRLSPLWVPTLHFYFPLGAFASYKAAWEMVTKPFYWDKTTHGLFDPLDGKP